MCACVRVRVCECVCECVVVGQSRPLSLESSLSSILLKFDCLLQLQLGCVEDSSYLSSNFVFSFLSTLCYIDTSFSFFLSLFCF